MDREYVAQKYTDEPDEAEAGQGGTMLAHEREELLKGLCLTMIVPPAFGLVLPATSKLPSLSTGCSDVMTAVHPR